jgi:hypothetical protein
MKLPRPSGSGTCGEANIAHLSAVQSNQAGDQGVLTVREYTRR